MTEAGFDELVAGALTSDEEFKGKLLVILAGYSYDQDMEDMMLRVFRNKCTFITLTWTPLFSSANNDGFREERSSAGM
jgi:hypothetical protein